MKVEFYSYEAKKGTVKKTKVLVVSLENGKMVFTGQAGIKENVMAGVRYQGKEYLPKDGEAFMKVLPYVYSGTYLSAALVKDEAKAE